MMRPEIQQKDIILTSKIDKSIQFELFDKLLQNKRWGANELKNRIRVESMIKEMYAKGCRPMVKINSNRLTNVEQGRLNVYKDIVGAITFGAQQESLEEGQQWLILDIPLEEMAPVYNGPDQTFNGNVYITHKRILPEFVRVVEMPESKKPELRLVEESRESTEKVMEPKQKLEKTNEERQWMDFEPKAHKEWELQDEEAVSHLIDKMYDRGIRPMVVVDRNSLGTIAEEGLMPKTVATDFKKNLKSQEVYATKTISGLRGFFGRLPINHEIPKERQKWLLLDIPRNRIKPVFGGKDERFGGAVDIMGGWVDPKLLKEIDTQGASVQHSVQKLNIHSERPQPSAN
jgi:hypothetical protein